MALPVAEFLALEHGTEYSGVGDEVAAKAEEEAEEVLALACFGCTIPDLAAADPPCHNECSPALSEHVPRIFLSCSHLRLTQQRGQLRSLCPDSCRKIASVAEAYVFVVARHARRVMHGMGQYTSFEVSVEIAGVVARVASGAHVCCGAGHAAGHERGRARRPGACARHAARHLCAGSMVPPVCSTAFSGGSVAHRAVFVA